MNKHLETVTRNWDILPWHFKAKIVLICEYYYLREKARVFLSGVFG